MKIYMLPIVIIMLFSGCMSMKRDINSEKLANDKPGQKKEVIDPQIDQKIAALEYLNDWFSYPVAQNRVQKTGAFSQPYSRGGIYFEMYYDEKEVKNYAYYDYKLRGDLGRRGQSVKEGILYINPADKAAIYYYPKKEGEFDVLKVRIKKVEPVPEPVPEPAKTKSAKK